MCCLVIFCFMFCFPFSFRWLGCNQYWEFNITLPLIFIVYTWNCYFYPQRAAELSSPATTPVFIWTPLTPQSDWETGTRHFSCHHNVLICIVKTNYVEVWQLKWLTTGLRNALKAYSLYSISSSLPLTSLDVRYSFYCDESKDKSRTVGTCLFAHDDSSKRAFRCFTRYVCVSLYCTFVINCIYTLQTAFSHRSFLFLTCLQFTYSPRDKVGTPTGV